MSVFQANSYPQPLKGIILFSFQRAVFKKFATVAPDRDYYCLHEAQFAA